jgi:hypothetical protein
VGITVVGNSFAAPGSPGTSLTLGVPAGSVSGTLMLAFIGGTGAFSGNAPTPPTGWTLLNAPLAFNGQNLNIMVYYRYAGASEPSSYTWTSGFTFGVSIGGIVTLAGAALSSPFDAQSNNTGTGTPTANSVTTTTSHDYLFGFFGTNTSSSMLTLPGGFTTFWNVPYSAGVNYGLALIGKVLSSSGATGNITASPSLPFVGVQIAILPSAGPSVSGTFTAYTFKRAAAVTGTFEVESGDTYFKGDLARYSTGTFENIFGAYGTNSAFKADVTVTVVINPLSKVTGSFFTRGIFTGAANLLPAFPTLPGLTWPVTKNPMGDAIQQNTQTGGVTRLSSASQPRWHFKLVFSFLRTASAYKEFQQLMSFFLAQLGQTGEFLYDDPHDDTATTQIFAGNTTTIGGAQPLPNPDGVQKVFQLGRFLTDSSGNNIAYERIYAPKSGVTIYDNGSSVSSAIVGPTGAVYFPTAPVASHTLTWTGGFYFRCRFLNDETNFDKVWYQMWSNKQLEFYSTKP